MRITYSLPAWLIALLLQGCSTCYTKSVVNVRPIGTLGDFELQETQPYVTRILVPDLLDIRVGLCTPISEQFVCLHLRVAPGKTAMLSSSNFEIARAGSLREYIPIPPQQYQILCESRGNVSMQCPSPPEINSPELSPKLLVNSGSYKDWKFERWTHTVQAATSFQGIVGDPDPPAWKLLSKYSGWHEYRLQLAPGTSFTETDALLQLPDIIISGRHYVIPKLSVKVAPTNICPVYA